MLIFLLDVCDLPEVEYRATTRIWDPELVLIIVLATFFISTASLFYLSVLRIRQGKRELEDSLLSNNVQQRGRSDSIFWENINHVLRILLVAIPISILLVLGEALWRRGYGMEWKMDPVRSYESRDCNVDDTPFTIVFLSDTQFTWGVYGTPKEVFDTAGVNSNRFHAMTVNFLINNSSFTNSTWDLYPAPTAAIMNGDLTEFGHEWQWNLHQRMYVRGTPNAFPEAIQMDIYPGLGNHDYTGNSENGWGPWEAVFTWGSSWLTRNSLKYIDEFVMTNSRSIISFDPSSRSYSWDIYYIHFIQLHFSPAYYDRRNKVDQSYEWLRSDLEEASKNDKRVVINVHSNEDLLTDKTFLDLLDTAQVITVSSGHQHPYIGLDKVQFNSTAGKIIPAFHCGSANYNHFSVIRFHSPPISYFDIWSFQSESGIPVLINQSQVYYPGV